MSEQRSSAQAAYRRPVVGGVVGSILGGVGRFLVVALFFYYVLNWGGPFFRQDEGVSLLGLFLGLEKWPVFILSTGIGMIAGGLGGATCRPLLGSAIGGGLSGLFCIGLAVLPTNLAIGMSGGGVVDYSTDREAIGFGLLSMIVVGAIAGGMGALAGKSLTLKAPPVA